MAVTVINPDTLDERIAEQLAILNRISDLTKQCKVRCMSWGILNEEPGRQLMHDDFRVPALVELRMKAVNGVIAQVKSGKIMSCFYAIIDDTDGSETVRYKHPDYVMPEFFVKTTSDAYP